MKKYYAMYRKKDEGCPVGYISWILFDKFYPKIDSEHIKYGEFPWYAFNREGKIESFPSSVCLIFNDSILDFDIRAESGNYFILFSESAYSCFSAEFIDFDDVRPVLVVNSEGATISRKKHYVARLSPINIEEVDSGDSVLQFNKYGRPIKIKKLTVRDGFESDLFRLHGMQGASQTLICSEKIKDELIKNNASKGVGFLDISELQLEPYWNFEAI